MIYGHYIQPCCIMNISPALKGSWPIILLSNAVFNYLQKPNQVSLKHASICLIYIFCTVVLLVVFCIQYVCNIINMHGIVLHSSDIIWILIVSVQDSL